MNKRLFKSLIKYLEKVPAIEKPIAFGSDDCGLWWVKFKINLTHRLAWQVFQEIGCVCNYLSPNERLPTTFYPVSPPPYLNGVPVNGGPEHFLSWVIDTINKDFSPNTLKKWLEGRLPRPIDDLSQWQLDEADE